MRRKEQLIQKGEKDGIIRTVTKIEECKTYWVREYYDKNTGSFGSIMCDEEGEIVDGRGGHIPEIVKSA